MANPFPAEAYASALRAAKPTKGQLAMLRVHYAAPARVVSYRELAGAAGYQSADAAHLQYGTYARRVAQWLKIKPHYWVNAIADDVMGTQGRPFRLRMRPEAAAGLESLGWVMAKRSA